MMLKLWLASSAVFTLLTPTAFSADGNQSMCLCKFVAPVYSVVARSARIQGIVRIEIQFDPEGTPQRLTVAESSHPILSEYALKAVKEWRFCPSSGTPHKDTVTVTFAFKLEGTTKGWSPTHVAFGPSPEVNITTSAISPELQQ